MPVGQKRKGAERKGAGWLSASPFQKPGRVPSAIKKVWRRDSEAAPRGVGATNQRPDDGGEGTAAMGLVSGCFGEVEIGQPGTTRN